MVNEKNPDGEFAENGDGPQPDIADEQAEAVENTIDGEQTSLDKSVPSEGNFEGPTAEELAALVRAVDRFFTPLEVPRQKTEDFRDSKPEELESRVIAAVTSSVQGTRLDPFTNLKSEGFHIASPHIIGGWGANVEVRKYTSATTLETMLANSMESIQRDPSELARHYVVLCIDLTDDKVFEKVDRLRRENDASYRAAGLHVVWPEQAWTLIFGQTGDNVEIPAINMMSDEAIDGPDADRLGFEAYANAIFGLIDHPDTKTPFTLAINARWGMGKSSLASLVDYKLKSKLPVWNETELRWDESHQTYWFNAWMHDEADRLGAAFMADIVRACHARLPLHKRVLRPIPPTLADPRRKSRWVFVWILVLAFVLAVGIFRFFNSGFDDLTLPVVGKICVAELGFGGGLFAVFLAILFLLPKVMVSLKAIAAFVSASGDSANAVSLHAVRRELESIIRDVTPKGSKFVVFIDDLERCRDTNAVGVLEVVNQLLSFDPVVCVIVADMPAVATCVEIKYSELAEKYDPGTGTKTTEEKGEAAYGRLFLQKFIQLQFDLPPTNVQPLLPMSETTNPANSSGLVSGENSEMVEREERLDPVFTAMLDFADDLERVAAPCHVRDGRAHEREINPFETTSWHRLARLAVFAPIYLMGYFQMIGTRVIGTRVYKPSLGNRFFYFIVAMVACFSWWMLLTLAAKFGFLSWTRGDFVGPLDTLALLILSSGCFPALYGMVSAILESHRHRLKKRDQARKLRDKLSASTEEHATSDQSEIELSRLSEVEIEAIRQDINRHRLADETSHWFREASAVALRELELAPRNVKRLVNRLRLLLFTLYSKDLLSKKNGLDPTYIGKWIAIQEGWPVFAQMVFLDPVKFSWAVEASTDDTTWEEFLAMNCPIYLGNEPLRTAVQGESGLANIAPILTRFEIPRHEGARI